MDKQLDTVDKEKAEKQIAEFRPNPAFSTALVPRGFKEAMEMATVLAKSNVVPKDMIGRPESCFVAIGFGMELGLPPLQAIQNIMVVNGRPAIWGDAAFALVKGSGFVKQIDEDAPDVALKQGYGRCRITTADGTVTERRFSVDEAKRAKLWVKQGPWQDYPGRMLQMRARSWAMRDAAPQVLKGIQFREEMADIEIIHPPVQMPERAKRPETAQEATIVPKTEQTPLDTPNAPPAPNQEAERGSETGMAGPDDVLGVSKPDPALKITDDRRKELFKMWTDAKIGLPDVKAKVKELGAESTADLTNGQAEALEVWIVQNAKA